MVTARHVLKRAAAPAAEAGYVMNVGPEPEFFLFQRPNEPIDPRHITVDRAGYLDLAPHGPGGGDPGRDRADAPGDGLRG